MVRSGADWLLEPSLATNDFYTWADKKKHEDQPLISALDQNVANGFGRWMFNDLCFLCGLHPLQPVREVLAYPENIERMRTMIIAMANWYKPHMTPEVPGNSFCLPTDLGSSAGAFVFNGRAHKKWSKAVHCYRRSTANLKPLLNKNLLDEMDCKGLLNPHFTLNADGTASWQGTVTSVWFLVIQTNLIYRRWA
jgi:hypothetical protein